MLLVRSHGSLAPLFPASSCPRSCFSSACCATIRNRIPQGHPIRFNQLEVFEDVIARHKSIRFDVESVGDGFTWRRQSSSVEIDEDTLDDQMRARISTGAQSLRADAFVKALLFCVWRVPAARPPSAGNIPRTRQVNDPHLEAKGTASDLEFGNIGDRYRSARCIRRSCGTEDGFGCRAFAQRLSTVGSVRQRHNFTLR